MSKSTRARIPAGPDLDHYAAMTLYDVELNERRQLEEHKQRTAQKHLFRKQLDEQVRFQQREARRKQEEDEQWSIQEQRRLKHWNEQEKSKQAAEREKLHKQKQVRDAQMVDVEQRRQLEIHQRQKEEKVLLRNIKKEVQQARAKEVLKKQQENENLHRIVTQNEKYQKEMDKVRELEQAEDQAMMHKYSNMLDQQEKTRLRALKATYSRQQAQMQMGQFLQQTADAKAEADEARARQVQADNDRRRQTVEQAQKERIKALKAEQQQVLAIQVREKHARQSQQHAQVMAEGQRLKNAINTADSKDQAGRRAVRERNIAHRKLIQQQIQNNAQRRYVEPYLMSQTERAFNSALLNPSMQYINSSSPPQSPTVSVHSKAPFAVDG